MRGRCLSIFCLAIKFDGGEGWLVIVIVIVIMRRERGESAFSALWCLKAIIVMLHFEVIGVMERVTEHLAQRVACKVIISREKDCKKMIEIDPRFDVANWS